MVLLIVKEAIVGLAFAFALSAIVAAVQMAAGLIDTMSGFSYASIVDPFTSIQGGIFGQLYSLFVAVVLVVTGGDQIMIAGLAGTFDVVPLTATPSMDAIGQLALDSFAQVFVLGLEVAAPAADRAGRRRHRDGARRPRGAAAEHVLGRPAGQDPRGRRGRDRPRCRSSPTTCAPSSRARWRRRSSRSAGRPWRRRPPTAPRRRHPSAGRRRARRARSPARSRSTRRSCCWRRVAALAVFGPRMLTDLENVVRDGLITAGDPSNAARGSVDDGAARQPERARPRGRADRARRDGGRRARERAAGAARGSRRGAQAVVREAQPAHGLQARLRRERAGRVRQGDREDGRRRRRSTFFARLAASCRASARSSASRPRRCPRSPAGWSCTSRRAPWSRCSLLAALDFVWQRYRHEKSLRMSKQEVKQEGRQSRHRPRGARADPPAAAGGRAPPDDGRRPDRGRRRHEPDALRRRAALRRQEARAARSSRSGADLVAAAIREIAREHGVPVLSNPPLARALYTTSRSASRSPTGFFAAVAEVLAFVYRTRAAASAGARPDESADPSGHVRLGRPGTHLPPRCDRA